MILNFPESSVQSKITMDGQADKWGFLPLNINHPRINVRFDDFIKSLDPGLTNDAENRTRALQLQGKDDGFTRDVEIIFICVPVPCRLIKLTVKEGLL